MRVLIKLYKQSKKTLYDYLLTKLTQVHQDDYQAIQK